MTGVGSLAESSLREGCGRRKRGELQRQTGGLEAWGGPRVWHVSGAGGRWARGRILWCLNSCALKPVLLQYHSGTAVGQEGAFAESDSAFSLPFDSLLCALQRMAPKAAAPAKLNSQKRPADPEPRPAPTYSTTFAASDADLVVISSEWVSSLAGKHYRGRPA